MLFWYDFPVSKFVEVHYYEVWHALFLDKFLHFLTILIF